MVDIHHLIQSRYSQSSDDFDKVLDTITDKKELAEIYYKLGYCYCRTYGDLEQSDNCYNKALLIFEENGLREKYILTLRDMYVNNELRGEYDKALNGFADCFEMSREINYEYGICIATGGIALLYLHLEDMQNPKVLELLDEVRRLAKRNDSDLLRESALIGEALTLIFEPRLKHQMRGQEILEGLIDSEFSAIKTSAIEFLLISYLEEMIRTSNKELLVASNKLIKSLIPSSRGNLIQKFRFTILESKLNMVDGDLETTKILLEELLTEISNAGEKRFIRFIDEIKSELDNLDEEYIKWSELVSNNASFKEKLDFISP